MTPIFVLSKNHEFLCEPRGNFMALSKRGLEIDHQIPSIMILNLLRKRTCGVVLVSAFHSSAGLL